MTERLIGANPDQLDQTAARIDRAAERVSSMHSEMIRLVQASSWSGRDADQFQATWRSRGRSSLESAAELLRETADTLRRNAADQRRTSDAATGALASGGGGTPGGFSPMLVAASFPLQSPPGPGGPTPQPSPGPTPEPPPQATPQPSPGPSPTPPPDIPPAPANPPHDPGAGEHGSDPWYSRGDDIVFHGVAATAATAADAMGMTNAARNLRHYLNNSGGSLEVEPDRIARDVPGFKQHVETQARNAAASAARRAIAEGRYGQPIPFTTGWSGFYITPEQSQDWFYAVGGVQTAASGVVVVHPGQPPQVEVSYQTHLYDRYNWDEGKAAQIGPVTITDHQMGELHRAGLAKEYDVTGSSGTVTYRTTDLSPSPSSEDGSLPDPGRRGTRSDPIRDQQPGRSRTSVDGTRAR